MATPFSIPALSSPQGAPQASGLGPPSSLGAAPGAGLATGSLNGDNVAQLQALEEAAAGGGGAPNGAGMPNLNSLMGGLGGNGAAGLGQMSPMQLEEEIMLLEMLIREEEAKQNGQSNSGSGSGASPASGGGSPLGAGMPGGGMPMSGGGGVPMASGGGGGGGSAPAGGGSGGSGGGGSVGSGGGGASGSGSGSSATSSVGTGPTNNSGGPVDTQQSTSGGPPQVQAMIDKANSFLGQPYVFGGGHGGWLSSPQGVDCSGFVSQVLHAGGLLSSPESTPTLGTGPGFSSGPGQHVTVFVNPGAGENGHTIIEMNNQFYESGGSHGPWGGGGGVEKIGHPSAEYLKEFTRVVHPSWDQPLNSNKGGGSSPAGGGGAKGGGGGATTSSAPRPASTSSSSSASHSSKGSSSTTHH
jgi:hypothetical protein